MDFVIFYNDLEIMEMLIDIMNEIFNFKNCEE